MKSSVYIPQRQLDNLERTGNRIAAELNRGRQRTLLKAARKVRKRIRQKAPRGPKAKPAKKRLKNAAYAKVLPATMTRPAVAFAGVRPRRAPHAHLVEYGHGGPHPAPPHPFMRPAWDSIKDEVKRDINGDVKQTVEGSV